MQRIVFEEAITGLPKLKIEEGKISGECQIGKQTKMSHPKLQYQTTSRVLELLHMDLMGPMQVESLGCKRYAYVVLDVYSRFNLFSNSPQRVLARKASCDNLGTCKTGILTKKNPPNQVSKCIN